MELVENCNMISKSKSEKEKKIIIIITILKKEAFPFLKLESNNQEERPVKISSQLGPVCLPNCLVTLVRAFFFFFLAFFNPMFS